MLGIIVHVEVDTRSRRLWVAAAVGHIVRLIDAVLQSQSYFRFIGVDEGIRYPRHTKPVCIVLTSTALEIYLKVIDP